MIHFRDQRRDDQYRQTTSSWWSTGVGSTRQGGGREERGREPGAGGPSGAHHGLGKQRWAEGGTGMSRTGMREGKTRSLPEI